MTAPKTVERADNRPVRLPPLSSRMSWWHPVCLVFGAVPVVLLIVGVTL